MKWEFKVLIYTHSTYANKALVILWILMDNNLYKRNYDLEQFLFGQTAEFYDTNVN